MMREQIRRILEGYVSAKLESQDGDSVSFSAHEPDTGRPVWITVLPRELAKDAETAARIGELSHAIRQLKHRSIAAVQRIGTEGLPYIVARALEHARPLADKLGQPWAVDAAADVVMQTGEALRHAASKGVVHGSLSPQNILVQDDGQVVVTDFGAASLLDLLSIPARRAVSPYLAPERKQGKAADAHSDVYSLAAILYSLLTGQPPRLGEGEIVPPSRFNPDVPPAMDQVVLRGLGPDRAQRYRDVKSFLAALGAVTLAPTDSGEQPEAGGVTCPQCGSGNQTGRFCRKCGSRLKQPASPVVLAPAKPPTSEPIQITKIDVGHIEVGKGVEMTPTPIAEPISVATGAMSDLFPEPPEVPLFDPADLWSVADGGLLLAMPEPPPMPVIDWAEIAPSMPEVPAIEDIFTQFDEGET